MFCRRVRGYVSGQEERRNNLLKKLLRRCLFFIRRYYIKVPLYALEFTASPKSLETHVPQTNLERAMTGDTTTVQDSRSVGGLRTTRSASVGRVWQPVITPFSPYTDVLISSEIEAARVLLAGVLFFSIFQGFEQ